MHYRECPLQDFTFRSDSQKSFEMLEPFYSPARHHEYTHLLDHCPQRGRAAVELFLFRFWLTWCAWHAWRQRKRKPAGIPAAAAASSLVRFAQEHGIDLAAEFGIDAASLAGDRLEAYDRLYLLERDCPDIPRFNMAAVVLIYHLSGPIREFLLKQITEMAELHFANVFQACDCH